MRPPVRWLLLLLACQHLAVLAADGERTRIAAERQVLLERFAQEERDCQQRFAVTTCLDDVRSRRRAALAPLRARELQLDDAERQQRAADRRAAIEAKQKAQAARPPPTPAPEVRLRPPPVPASSASAASAPRHKTDDAQARAAQAAERAQAAQRRREAAEADRQRIERRLAEREAAGKVAAPLPVPSSAPGH
jgi:hypothetical protein